MKLILDGNLEIGAHVKSNRCYLICSRHLIRYGGVTNQTTCSKLPSNISTMSAAENRKRAKEYFFASLNRPIFLHVRATCSELPSSSHTNSQGVYSTIGLKIIVSDPKPYFLSPPGSDSIVTALFFMIQILEIPKKNEVLYSKR